MDKYDVYNDIANRTGGDIYCGVVGPVRSGKSTFISRFMELLVLPNISDKNVRKRATDELPQSAAGKTIMTTEPKFVPAEAVEVSIKEKAKFKVRMIDCVGYLIDDAIGHKEGDKARLVQTPWQTEPLPFERAAELGTQKVINEHSTIGILITCDGSVTEIERKSYVRAEERVVSELKAINKPFAVILNSKEPHGDGCEKLAASLEDKYKVPVIPLSVANMTADDIRGVLERVLFEFPIRMIDVRLPKWMYALPVSSDIVTELISSSKLMCSGMGKMRDYESFEKCFSDSESFSPPQSSEVLLGEGRIVYNVSANEGVFNRILSDIAGEDLTDDFTLMNYVSKLSRAKTEYDKLKSALDEVAETGYGIVRPSIDDMSLQEPEIMRQGGRFGVRLRASAPSLHIMRVDINTEVDPVVGTEQQSEELVKYLLSEFENDPKGIWETNMFGKSLHDLVKENLNNKLHAIPADAQKKMRKTLGRIVNEGKGGMICILL